MQKLYPGCSSAIANYLTKKSEMKDCIEGDFEGTTFVQPSEEKAKGRFHCCLQLQNGRD